jgi:hypothetical protein
MSLLNLPIFILENIRFGTVQYPDGTGAEGCRVLTGSNSVTCSFNAEHFHRII